MSAKWHLSYVHCSTTSYDKRTSKPVAIKTIDLENAEDEIDDIHAEIRMLADLDSEVVTK